MTAQHDLPTQIAAARRSHDQMPSPVMVSIIATLEWLYANQPKIKAKVQTLEEYEAGPQPVPDAESTGVYRLGNAVFLDLAKGGWQRRYDVLDEAGQVIGTKIEGAETRSGKPYVAFEPFGYRTFDTAKAFIAAEERGQWKPKHAEAA
jgi:hypothetical protein